MNKTKKALASLAIAGMVLSMAPVSVFAADEDTRLAGADRYLTSIKIAEKAYASADTAVVAAGNPNNLVDALAAAPLAAQEDAPIYLTDKADMNDDVVKSMKALGVDKVIVVGAAASKAVVDELKAAGFSVEEVKGAGRVETAEAINKKLTAPAGTFVVGYDGVADAMSVASYAAANNYAIVVANQNGTPNGTVDADYIVGGTTRVKDIAGAKRLAGADRYDTNKQVIAELDFDFGKVYVGNGLTLADALVGSVLAAQTNSPIALTDGKTVKADVASNLTDDSVIVALGGTAAVSNAVVDAVKNPPSTGVFEVESVKASAANAIKVTFGKAADDVEKVTFEVKQGQSNSATAVNVTWNEAKTEATLSKSSNFVSGAYTVSVKTDAKDLGAREITFTEQKVAKIDITSTKLGVVTKTKTDGQEQTGYATYKIFDQYGVDITNSALANNVEFQSGVAKSIEGRKGLITLVASDNLNLLSFAGGIVITANDRTSGVSTTATLAATSQIGTLSDIVLNKLVSADGTEKELTVGRSSDIFYIDYTATDISGNPTTNYDLVYEGLILSSENANDSEKVYLTTSNPDVKAKVIKDPQDSSKALIELRAEEGKELTVDTPVIITAMTWTGKTSQLNLTLKKQDEVSKFTLFAPDEAVAHGDTVSVPFVAYDQNGKEITKLKDLEKLVSLNNANWGENIDGTAKVEFKAENTGTVSVPRVITSTVSRTGHYSSVTINVQKKAYADALSLDTTVLKSLMQSATTEGTIQVAATQTIDLGWDAGGLAVKDQYDRDMDMTTLSDDDNKNYYVEAKSTDEDVIKVEGQAKPGANQIKLTALESGSATVTFKLYERLADGKLRDVDSKSQTLTVVKDDDIKDYVIDAVPDAIYAANGVLGALNPSTSSAITVNKRVEAFAANPKVYGTTSSGAKVILRGKPVLSASVNSPYFSIAGDIAKGDAGYKGVKVVANKLPDSWTEASTTLDVTVLGADNKVYSVTTDLKSSKATLVAKDIKFEAQTQLEGVTFEDDVLTVKKANIDTVFGSTLDRFAKDSEGVIDAASNGDFVHFYVVDQYGKKGMKFSRFVATEQKDGCKDVKVAADGTITGLDSATKGSFKVSAVVGGLVKTIMVKIVD